tara:strand:- start:207847 stop:208326 length:480 start_codon:yes stop_codon:yes gene_type:complete
MIDLELELVSENPSWIAVLKAYQKAQEELAEQQAQAAAKSAQAEKINSGDPESSGSTTEADKGADADSGESGTDEDFEEGNSTAPRKRASRWVQRVTSLPGLDAAELSKIHGRLIAYDLLKCDLAGRSDGMVYQLTTSGRTILSRYGDETPEADDRSAA